MNSGIIEAHDESADVYDDMSEKLEWRGHEALFGMAYEYVNPGETLLDIGIGTGLSSYLFYRAGLNVYGVDGSEPMLEECRKKGFAAGLKTYDLGKGGWPYPDGAFDHAVACGLFHFFDKLDVFFSETSRVLKNGGVFCLTVMDTPGDERQSMNAEYGVNIYLHDKNTMTSLAGRYGFVTLKRMSVFTYRDLEKNSFNVFTLYIMRHR